MIIGVDAGALAITDERLKVGVYRVTFNLLKKLSTLDTVHQYRLYSFRPIERGVMAAFGPRMTNAVLQPAKGWLSLRLPIELKLRPVDVFLGLAQALPSLPSFSIGFIYDLGFLYYPEAYGDSAKKLANQTAQLVKRANHIITISESSQKDILHQYGIEKDKVTVAYPGIFLRPHLAMLQDEALRNSRPYFLFVGSLNKAKDVPLAIEAFAMFLKKVNKPYDLYLIGGDYWPDPEIDASINRCKLNDRVKKLGFVPDEKLLDYYRGATALVVTSLREGFCLPAAEAMACGTPVVTVDRGAMKEVVGEGGILVKESSVTAIADALFLIASDIGLRKKLARKALEQSKKYTWGRFAESVMSLY